MQRQKEEIERRTKSVVNADSKVEVKEIQLKCFNSSTSKKNKGEYGDFIDNKGVLEFLVESCSLILKKEVIANDLRKMNLDIKEKDSQTNVLQEMFKRCDELDPKGNMKLTPETIKRIIEQFRRPTEINMIIDNINNNFIDFQKFFSLFLKPLRIYDKESETFKVITDLINQVAKGLFTINPENA